MGDDELQGGSGQRHAVFGADGLDLQRDVLDQAATPLRVSEALKTMDAALFRAETMGLAL